MKLGRREFLRGLSGATALSLASPALLLALTGCGRRGPLSAALGEFFADPASAALVGRAYLLLAPDEDDPQRLVQRLAGDRRAEWEDLAVADPAALAERVRGLHLEDFAEGRVVQVRGWVLSRTEARLCALAALG